MQELLTQIRNSKSKKELYNLLKAVPEVYLFIFRKEITAKVGNFEAAKKQAGEK